MSVVDGRSLGVLLGVRPKPSGRASPLDLADAICKGLSVSALDRVCRAMAPDEPRFRYRIAARATLARRRLVRGRRLSRAESECVARLARVWAFALDVWKSPGSAQHFLGEPHMLLRGRVPRELAAESEFGARSVEDVLGGLKYGTAA